MSAKGRSARAPRALPVTITHPDRVIFPEEGYTKRDLAEYYDLVFPRLRPWIEDRLLKPGDYNYGEPGASDQRVYSETGCTCVLITSPSDVLR